MCEECALYIPVSRLLDHSGFGKSFGYVKDVAINNMQKIISLGGCFMWNNAVVCGGRMELKILVRD